MCISYHAQDKKIIISPSNNFKEAFRSYSMIEVKDTITTRVRYGETDKMGVAYYGRYMDWFEMGRTEFCRTTGKSFAQWEAEGILLPVVEAHCRYKLSLKYDDEIEIETSIGELKTVSIIFKCRIFLKDGHKLAAEGYTKHAFVSSDGKLLRGGCGLERSLREILGE